jgi:hypothetical protein
MACGRPSIRKDRSHINSDHRLDTSHHKLVQLVIKEHKKPRQKAGVFV